MGKFCSLRTRLKIKLLLETFEGHCKSVIMSDVFLYSSLTDYFKRQRIERINSTCGASLH
jgi:hypothetical protein